MSSGPDYPFRKLTGLGVGESFLEVLRICTHTCPLQIFPGDLAALFIMLSYF